MNWKSLSGWIVVSLALAAPAYADSTTPEEAQRLKTLFERHIGSPAAGQPSAVSVLRVRGDYVVSFDIARLLAPLKLSAEGFTVADTEPFTAVLTPQADGTWHVTVDGLPPVNIAKADQAMTFAFNGYKLDGVFDPKIETFKSSTAGWTGFAVHTTGTSGTSDAQATLQQTTTSTAEDAGNRTVNATASQNAKDYGYKFNLTIPSSDADKPPTTVVFDAHATALTGNLVAKNERVASLDDLWLFLVDHAKDAANKDARVAAQADLKTRLKALLPFVSAISGDLAVSNLLVNAPQGQFSLANVAEHYEFPDAQTKQGVTVGFKASGLTLPEGLLPPWANGLLPTAVDVTQSYGPINLTVPLATAIDELDLSADQPLTDAQTTALGKGIVSLENFTFAIQPSTITSQLVTMKLQGQMRMAGTTPTGSANVAATGLDKAIEQIRSNAADDPDALQVVNFLVGMKALAKAEGPDSYSWAIEALPGHPVTINGNALPGTAAADPVPVAPPAVDPTPAPPAPPVATAKPKKKPTLKNVP